MTGKIKEAAEKLFPIIDNGSLNDWINASKRSVWIDGATSEAAREYWEGQKDEEIARLTQKVEFYRQTTDKVRELIFSRNDIGQPCQPLYDCIYDKITSQDSEIARLKEDVKELKGYKKEVERIKKHFTEVCTENKKKYSDNTAILVFVQKMEESITWVNEI